MINLAGSRSPSSKSYTSPSTNEPVGEFPHADFNDELDGSQPFLSPFPQPPPPNPAEPCLAITNPTSLQHQAWETRGKVTGLGGSYRGGKKGLGSLSCAPRAALHQPSLEQGWWHCVSRASLETSSSSPFACPHAAGAPGRFGCHRPSRHTCISHPCPAPGLESPPDPPFCRQQDRAQPLLAAHREAAEMSVILGCRHRGGGRSAATRPPGTRSPLQGCCAQRSRPRSQPEQGNLDRVQKRAGSESRQRKICITVTERRSSGCLVY